MTQFDSTEVEGTDLEPRTRRALERVASVTPDIGRARGVPGMTLVTSGNSGNSYLVDVRDGRCECPDAQHRDPDGGCWHVRRARFALGRAAIPADAVLHLDVDPDLGQHTDATLRFAAADGGIIEADDDGEILTDGGDDDKGDGRPDDCDCGVWNDGLDLPCWPCHRVGFDTPAVGDKSSEPMRHEPADFGGGDSTGVQDL